MSCKGQLSALAAVLTFRIKMPQEPKKMIESRHFLNGGGLLSGGSEIHPYLFIYLTIRARPERVVKEGQMSRPNLFILLLFLGQ